MGEGHDTTHRYQSQEYYLYKPEHDYDESCGRAQLAYSYNTVTTLCLVGGHVTRETYGYNWMALRSADAR